MGFTDDQCSQQSANYESNPEEEKKSSTTNSLSQAATKPATGAYRPQFRLKSQYSQKTFSSQQSASQHSISGDETNNERQEQRMQDFVARSSKKRTSDMITQNENQQYGCAVNEMKELSPVEHIAKYFKKLKQARED